MCVRVVTLYILLSSCSQLVQVLVLDDPLTREFSFGSPFAGQYVLIVSSSVDGSTSLAPSSGYAVTFVHDMMTAATSSIEHRTSYTQAGTYTRPLLSSTYAVYFTETP